MGFYAEYDQQGKLIGKYYEKRAGKAEQYVEGDQEIYVEPTLETVKVKAYRLLSECDWVLLPDSKFNEAQKIAWVDYRNILRSMTSSDPKTVEFPPLPYPLER